MPISALQSPSDSWVSHVKKGLVVVIRGMHSILKWPRDYSFLMVPTSAPGSRGVIRDGFAAVYRSLLATPNAKTWWINWKDSSFF
jgi:hypothetical protein